MFISAGTSHLFAYGTLQPGARGAMGEAERDRLAGEAEFVGPASTIGQLLNLGAYPGLIEGGRPVYGGLLLLDRPEITFEWLDAYEGITGRPGDEYVRRTRPVRLATGQSLQAWVYIYVGPRVGKSLIPTGFWKAP